MGLRARAAAADAEAVQAGAARTWFCVAGRLLVISGICRLGVDTGRVGDAAQARRRLGTGRLASRSKWLAMARWRVALSSDAVRADVSAAKNLWSGEG